LLWRSVLPVLFRRKLRLIITMDGITDITTEGITTDITITTITIGTGLGLSASMGVQGIIAIGKRIIVRTAFHHSLKARAQIPAIDIKLPL
jgi:hypothetical protein